MRYESRLNQYEYSHHGNNLGLNILGIRLASKCHGSQMLQSSFLQLLRFRIEGKVSLYQ